MSSTPPEGIPTAPAGAVAASPYGAPEFLEEEGGVDVRRYLAAVWRYRYLVIALAAVGFAAGFGLTKVVKPTYESQATIQVPAAPRGFPSDDPLRSAPLFDNAGWLSLLRSFEVLDDVVRQRRLFLEPSDPAESEYFAGLELDSTFRTGRFVVRRGDADSVFLLGETGQVLDASAAGDSLGGPLGIRWVPPALPRGTDVSFTVRAPRDAALRLSDDISAQLPAQGALMRVSLRGADPEFTATTLNTVATRFVTVASLLKRERLTTVRQVLREQLERAREELSTAEASLEQFRVNTITLPSERGASPIAPGLAETNDPVRAAFFRLRLERDELVRDRDAIQRALTTADDSLSSLVVSLGTIAAVRENLELLSSLDLLVSKRAEARQLRVAFSAAHPPLRALEQEIAALEATVIPQQAQVLLDNLSQRIEDYDQRIAASSRELQQIPVRVTEENRRERNVDIARLIFTELQSAHEQARLNELSAAPDVRVLDLAVPPTRPVRDQVLLLFAGAGLGGLGLGLALAILLDRFDRRLRYPDQVTHELGLPILGALPLLRTRRDQTPRPEDEEQMLEAMRSIRLALLLAHGTAGPFATTITSPGSGDGKSFVAAQLARSLALSGRRTILIDGDNRRGYLHRTLNVPRKPGLMDVIAGTATLERVVLNIEDGGFDFIASGTHRTTAPELLSSAEMRAVMMRLRGDYQAIVIDSPPLGAGVDPLVLGSLCGSLVMVLRNGVTDRELAEARLRDIERLPIRVLGAILNDVSPKGAYRYYSYLPGYRTEDEVEASAASASAQRRRLLGRA